MLGGAYCAFFARFFFFCCPVPSSFDPSCCVESFGFSWCLFPCNQAGSVIDGGGTYLAPFPSLFCLFLLSCSFFLCCVGFIGARLLLLILAGLIASVRGP